MNLFVANKRKIFNDPVYGFITIPDELIFNLIEHPYFQRLRRIRQLGLTHLVYPGALHTRFHHSIGAMHLIGLAIAVLKDKGQKITEEETCGAAIAILLHDIGHGPYSHTLEHSLVKGPSHEDISEIYMNYLNKEFNGKLEIGLQIFRNEYPKKFLHQLVSSQLDADRLDYLKRDSFFTGVSEGIINADRIIKMLQVVNDKLVVEAKGIYSIEKFLIARRLMYWQVYLHKTVLAAEYALMRVLKRAKLLAGNGKKIFATTALSSFLHENYSIQDFKNNPQVLSNYSQLDDFDILSALKEWIHHPDKVLSYLSNSIVNRRLFKIEMQDTDFNPQYIETIKSKVKKKFDITDGECDYFVFKDITSNYAYNPKVGQINILYKNGTIKDIAEASDQLNISVLSRAVTKYFLCYPKDLA
ncbi:MAG: HD domain-containing protein [Bacteroidetes bacterium]|nr:HD domain-containing protein [Bacteroidota bacterium]